MDVFGSDYLSISGVYSAQSGLFVRLLVIKSADWLSSLGHDTLLTLFILEMSSLFALLELR